MKIAEIFLSLSGEGSSIGKPAIFVRLAGCNQRCLRCDSQYSWSDGCYSETGVEAVVDSISRLRFQGSRLCDRVILTGGEPLLQQKDLEKLVRTLKSLGYYIEVETNGTCLVNPKLFLMIDKWNVSPKLSFMVKNGLQVQYSQFIKMKRVEFKFVVRNVNDLNEVARIAAVHKIPAWQITVMPEGKTPRRILSVMRKLADECISRGYRLLPREHVLIWKNVRGR